MTVKQQVWNYFIEKGFRPEGIAGIMGNLQHESAFIPNNVENRWNNSTGMSDAQYTAQVDNGTYNNFVYDAYGYGLPQYTYYTYKQQLLDMSKQRKVSIADVTLQLDLLCECMHDVGIYDSIKNATNLTDASNLFLLKFERPNDQSVSVQNARAATSKSIYTEMIKSTPAQTTTPTVSPIDTVQPVVSSNGKMKYHDRNIPLACMQTQSTCYRGTSPMTIKGVLWHSTGANNNTLKRYVQPDDNASNRAEMLALIGKNQYNNDWNHIEMQAGLNAWIGCLADGTVTTLQTMPWDYKPWGCGAGSRGSCNDGWIQFEICEDNLTNKSYFDKAYEEACQLTAYLCKMYNLNPKGSVTFAGIAVPVILCHQDSYQLGLGSNHSDVYHWFTKYGKTMDNVRADVAKLMEDSADVTPTPTPEPTPIPEPTPTPQPMPTPTPSNVLIRRGNSGPLVEALQTNLIALGYSCGPDGADGDFGPNTENAVRKFQADKKLEIDGIVGPETYNAIVAAIQNNTPTPTPTPAKDEIYRVRLAWDNPRSQIGAYRILQNAINACTRAGENYKVFNSAGEIVYGKKDDGSEVTPVVPDPTPTPDPVTPAVVYKGVKIGSSSKDERGSYRGGQAGDQTGEEVWIQDWYRGWDCVIRPNDPKVAEKMARECENACNNNNIGYDQNQRNTLYTEAKKVGFDLSKITTPCECDCSSLVSICCICAGMPESIFFAGGNMRTTYSLEAACNATGAYTVLRTSNYVDSKDYLKRGDILLNDGHTVIVLSNGDKAGNIAPTDNTIVTPTYLDEPYLVIIDTNLLNVRSGPSTDYAIVVTVKRNEIFTIVAEKGGWGKLKSGAGWIDLSYTKKYNA